MSNLSKQVLSVARTFADQQYKEKPGNDNQFGVWYGRNNVPWCAIFVSYCFSKAGAAPIVANVQTPKGFHSCTAAVTHYRHNNQIITAAQAQAGDIVFMDFTGNGEYNHVGLCISNNGKELHTVEGNTINPDGTGDQTNGDGVYYKHRRYQYITAVVRPSWKLLDKKVK